MNNTECSPSFRETTVFLVCIEGRRNVPQLAKTVCPRIRDVIKMYFKMYDGEAHMVLIPPQSAPHTSDTLPHHSVSF